MYDVDAETADQARQRRSIAAQLPRIFRCEREGQVCAAGSYHVALQRPARGGDVRSPSGSDQRAGDIDGTTFGAARAEARNDLEHCRGAAFRHGEPGVTVDAHSVFC